MSDQGFVYLTRERLLELEKELQNLKTNGRKEIANKIAEARAHGDLSENAEYDAAKEEQGLFELRISKLENIPDWKSYNIELFLRKPEQTFACKIRQMR